MFAGNQEVAYLCLLELVKGKMTSYILGFPLIECEFHSAWDISI